MKRMFPKACQLGFTGTPLMKKEKSTVAKFGGLIDIYAIDQAVKDGAAVPLLYEGRHFEQDVNIKASEGKSTVAGLPLAHKSTSGYCDEV
jgi:type I restriction enzyme R subunit